MSSAAFRRGRFRPAIALTALLATLGSAGPLGASSLEWRTECVGYYTLRLPGDVEYAVQQPPLERRWQPKFVSGLGVLNTRFSVGLNGDADELSDIRISGDVSKGALPALAKARNSALQMDKEDRLRMADRSDDSPGMQKRLRSEAGQISFFEPLNGETVFARFGEKGVEFDALIGTRIISSGLYRAGTPQQTIDGFLNRYRPRETFEVPTEPGVCLPYSFVAGESQPASVGISMRFKDRPDIVIYLHDGKDFTTLEPPPDAMAYVEREIRFGAFYGNRVTAPLDGTSNQYHSVTIDGRRGVGTFALVTRNSKPGPEAINNSANNDQDWAYLAYVSADKAATPGTSSDLVFKVERFGRFAKQSMTEHEFRNLVKTLAAGIKRRPGAWVQR